MSIGLFADYEKSIVLFGHERACPFILTIDSQQRLSYKFNLLTHLNYTFLTTSINHQSSSSFITFTEDFQSELFTPNTHLQLAVRFNHSASMSSVNNQMVSSNENWKKAGGKTKRGKPVGRREVLEKYKAIGLARLDCGNHKQLGIMSRVLVLDSNQEVELIARKFPKERRRANKLALRDQILSLANEEYLEETEDDAPKSHEESLEETEGKVREAHESREEADDESQLSDDESEPWTINECELFFGIKDCSICKWLAS